MFEMTREEYCQLNPEFRSYTDEGEPTLYIPGHGWNLVIIED